MERKCTKIILLIYFDHFFVEGVSNDDHICCATLTRAASSGNLPSFEGRETTENAEMSPQEMEKEKVEAYAGCGLTPYNNELPKVVQGREAKKNEFPWAVRNIPVL